MNEHLITLFVPRVVKESGVKNFIGGLGYCDDTITIARGLALPNTLIMPISIKIMLVHGQKQKICQFIAEDGIGWTFLEHVMFGSYEL